MDLHTMDSEELCNAEPAENVPFVYAGGWMGTGFRSTMYIMGEVLGQRRETTCMTTMKD